MTKPQKQLPLEVRERLLKTWNILVHDYLLAPDAFDMDLREDVASSELFEAMAQELHSVRRDTINEMLGLTSHMGYEEGLLGLSNFNKGYNEAVTELKTKLEALIKEGV